MNVSIDSTRPTRPTDAQLVAAARAGGPTASHAFAELVGRYQRMVYALALSLVHAPDDADDVAQDAFLRAFRNLDLLADPAKFGTWLRRIAFGVCIDHIRAEQARCRRTSGMAGARANLLDDRGRAATPDAPDSADLPDASASPLERLERGEVARRVMDALDRLPARYRVPLTLFHIDGLSHAKVAQALGVPEGTVRSLVARARRKLVTLLANSHEVRDMMPDSLSVPDPLDVLDEPPSPPPRLLHVLNGDSVRATLERSDVPGAFAVYADVLHEGPVPAVTDTPTWREVRARYVAASGYVPYAEARRTYEQWDERIASYADYDEVVLWFEHDLFDQLLLVRHLDWFARHARSRTALSLICIGEYPGVAPFHGLGQLDADQLASLLGTREPVSPRQLELGRRVWAAFTASEPSALDEITRRPGLMPNDSAAARARAAAAALDDAGASRETGASERGSPIGDEAGGAALPFLPGALRRLLEEYPAVGTGLSRTERHILELLSAGPTTAEALFLAEQRREERVFMGDWSFWRVVRELAAGAVPLVSLPAEHQEGPGLPRGPVAITAAGRDVLAGRADRVRLAGMDRWIGGVHLSAPLGGDVAWRYDAAARRLHRTE